WPFPAGTPASAADRCRQAIRLRSWLVPFQQEFNHPAPRSVSIPAATMAEDRLVLTPCFFQSVGKHRQAVEPTFLLNGVCEISDNGGRPAWVDLQLRAFFFDQAKIVRKQVTVVRPRRYEAAILAKFDPLCDRQIVVSVTELGVGREIGLSAQVVDQLALVIV